MQNCVTLLSTYALSPSDQPTKESHAAHLHRCFVGVEIGVKLEVRYKQEDAMRNEMRKTHGQKDA